MYVCVCICGARADSLKPFPQHNTVESDDSLYVYNNLIYVCSYMCEKYLGVCPRSTPIRQYHTQVLYRYLYCRTSRDFRGHKYVSEND